MFPLTRLSRVAFATAFACALPAVAADTIEPFDRGASDFELYMQHEGLGHTSAQQAVAGEMLLGYGLSDRVSGFVGAVLAADGHYLDASGSFSFGAYGNTYASGPWSIDVILSLAGAEDALTFSPLVEWNWDAEPDLAAWGCYVRAGLEVGGLDTAAGPRRSVVYPMTIGAYRTVRPGHQVLFEFEGGVADLAGEDPAASGHAWRTSALSFGYNALVSEAVEAVTQVSWMPGRDGQDGSAAVMVGFIATLPGGP